MKKETFKGLTATFGSFLSVAVRLSILAFNRAGDINRVLNVGTGNDSNVTEGTNYYPSEYKTKEERKTAEKDYLIQSQEEGSVLLRNKNNGLPLRDGSSDTALNVTLFGATAVNPIYTGGSGSANKVGIGLKEALEQKKNVKVNEKVYSAIESSIKSNNVKRGVGDIGEVPASTYKTSDFEGFKDAAIVVLGRYGGEQMDRQVSDKDGVPQLSFHESEKQLRDVVANGGFSKIIVLLNTGYARDLGWLNDYPVDACLWIGYPGNYGRIGVANRLTGLASPSGRLIDTYATNSLSSPARQNFGDFKFADLPNTRYHNEYLIYAEGIYVGYKYYETRYHDQVLNINDAVSAYGAFASTSGWNYDEEVQYTFGYGKSYASFTKQVVPGSFVWDKDNHVVSAKVKVKNDSDKYKGKDVIELYASLPYTPSRAEKSAIELIGFTKTDELNPGEEKEYIVTANDYLFATYDRNATNGKDPSKKGCYTFDAGDYYFSIGDNAHDALNNVMAVTNPTASLTDGFGNKVNGNSSRVYKYSLATLDNTTYATNPQTGAIVSNLFDDTDYNYFVKDKIKYLTRSDWKTFPVSYTGLNADEDTKGLLRKNRTATKDQYVKPEGSPDVTSFNRDAENGRKFVNRKNVPFSGEYTDLNGNKKNADEEWDKIIDQMSIADLCNITGEKMGNDAIESVNFPGNKAGDGPDGLQGDNTLHISESMACATFNTELIEERGKFLAEDAYWSDNNIRTVYGGGGNLHRTPYGGRNFEYYSEDSNIAYIMGEHQAKVMAKKGIVSCFKHFLGNDQETNRHGVATFRNEQTLRRNDARSFEGALSAGGALGNRGAYNRIGVVSASCSKALRTDRLRTEWGFKGVSMTDSSKDASSYLFTTDAINAGTNQFNNDADRAKEIRTAVVKGKDGNIYQKLRNGAKYFLYTYSHSRTVNGITSDFVAQKTTPWWQKAIYALDGTIGAVTVARLSLYVVCLVKEKKKGKENETVQK